MDIVAEERPDPTLCIAHYFVQPQRPAAAIRFFRIDVCGSVYLPVVPEACLLPRGHPVGRWLCRSHGVYRHVADGKKESRELVVVDCNKHQFCTAVFCKGMGGHRLLLLCIVNFGHRRLAGMAQQGNPPS